MINIHLIFILEGISIMFQLDKAIHYEDFYDGVFIEGLNVNQFAEAEEKITSYGLSLRETENSNVSRLPHNKNTKLLNNTYLFFIF